MSRQSRGEPNSAWLYQASFLAFSNAMTKDAFNFGNNDGSVFFCLCLVNCVTTHESADRHK
ncbi:hypothetical protein R77560_01105 [Ralstonia thomasii]|uniref:Uncharacterized protein n=1 Tax=Ralstonia thomasii TaxID=3058596 RepID=A0AAD2BUR3_9RALS|nr:hypothetical protein HMPREF0989_02986 [Ralstonia sp. 5_2_56FAA]CAJ0784019.1 hypothetical protein R77560_01105 [Ralstonia sp. LMG 18095]CAJ0879813.1 hypothetical protein R6138_02511 [Ralstonia sp. LMG 18095]SCW56707.1 hypothetical protein SAMN02799637_01366 [Ralstonia sp. UNCCL144]